MRQAELTAKRSKCLSRQVGCVVVIEDRIVSEGYNGTPKGYINCNQHFSEYNEHHHEWSNSKEIHAEMNCLLWSARKGIAVEGGVMYSTTKPCLQCTKNIIASGISKIYYKDEYPRNDDKDINEFLRACKVEVEKVSYES
jgi:dCMP deaminase